MHGANLDHAPPTVLEDVWAAGDVSWGEPGVQRGGERPERRPGLQRVCPQRGNLGACARACVLWLGPGVHCMIIWHARFGVAVAAAAVGGVGGMPCHQSLRASSSDSLSAEVVRWHTVTAACLSSRSSSIPSTHSVATPSIAPSTSALVISGLATDDVSLLQVILRRGRAGVASVYRTVNAT